MDRHLVAATVVACVVVFGDVFVFCGLSVVGFEGCVVCVVLFAMCVG